MLQSGGTLAVTGATTLSDNSHRRNYIIKHYRRHLKYRSETIVLVAWHGRKISMEIMLWEEHWLWYASLSSTADTTSKYAMEQ